MAGGAKNDREKLSFVYIAQFKAQKFFQLFLSNPLHSSYKWYIIYLKWGKVVKNVQFPLKVEKGERLMALFGEYRHSLDAKKRLFIPAKLRDGLGETLYITRGIDNCLLVFSETEWNKITEKLLSITDELAGITKLYLFSKTIDVTPDSQGRVTLSPDLINHAGIDKNTVIVGVGNQVQIWSESAWAEKERQASENLELRQLLRREFGL